MANEYIKSSTLQVTSGKLHIVSTLPVTAEAEDLVYIPNDGFYYYSSNQWTKLINLAADSVGNFIGEIIPSIGATGEDYLVCDGSTFNAATYPDLYNLLGTNVLPDYRECVLYGAGGDFGYNGPAPKSIVGHNHGHYNIRHTHDAGGNPYYCPPHEHYNMYHVNWPAYHNTSGGQEYNTRTGGFWPDPDHNNMGAGLHPYLDFRRASNAALKSTGTNWIANWNAASIKCGDLYTNSCSIGASGDGIFRGYTYYVKYKIRAK